MTFRLKNLPLLLLCFLSSLSSQLSAASVRLAWDANAEPDVAGYRLYWGPTPRGYTNFSDGGLQTTNEVPNLLRGATYYFAVTAYSTNGLALLSGRAATPPFTAALEIT